MEKTEAGKEIIGQVEARNWKYASCRERMKSKGDEGPTSGRGWIVRRNPHSRGTMSLRLQEPVHAGVGGIS